jgi:hypothetical protein
VYKSTSKFVNSSGWGRGAANEPGLKKYLLVTYHVQKNVVVCKEERWVSLQGANRRLKTKKFRFAEILQEEGGKMKTLKQQGDPAFKSRYEEQSNK